MADVETPRELEAETPPPPEGNSLGETLTHYWWLVRHYYWLILLISALTVAGAYAYTKSQPEIYQASSKIIFHKSQDNVLGRKIGQVELMDPGGRWEFNQFWNSQKAVFSANWFAKRVIKKEGLLQNETFMPDPPKGETRTKKEKMDVAVGKFKGVSRVHLQGESRVGVVSVRTESAELSAKIANAMAEEYVAYTEEFQSGGLKRITNWFDSYVASKKDELETAQQKLYEFKRKHNILSLSYEDRRNLTSKSMESINQKLVDVRGKLAKQEARLAQIKQMEDSKADPKAIADLVDNETLKTLYQRKSKLDQDLAELRAKYAEKHPEVRALTSQLEVVNENIESEIDRIHTATENKVAVLQKNETNLEGQLQGLRDKVFRLNKLGVDFKQLKNRVSNLKNLYNTVLQRSSELNINSMYERNDIEVLEKADVPGGPVSPSLPMNLALGLLVGLGLGATGAVVLDTLDTSIRSEEDITQLTDKPILAMLPELRSDVLRGLEPIGDSAADTVAHTAPKSSFTEGIKTLRTNLTFMSPDNPPRSLLVTSPGPGEGKTLTASNTAIAIAQSGMKTLLVDTDLRKPRAHTTLGIPKEEGVTDIVTQNEIPSEVIKQTKIENLDVLTSGDVPPNPSEMLHSQNFESLVEHLAAEYDRVIYDSPPLAAVSDALILSQLVDGVLLIVQFARTRTGTLAQALEQLRGIGAPLLGTVVNEVTSSKGGYYGYGYDYAYYRYDRYGDNEEQQSSDREDRLAS